MAVFSEKYATTAELDQTDEDILTYTVSDEVLEAAAGTGKGRIINNSAFLPCCFGEVLHSKNYVTDCRLRPPLIQLECFFYHHHHSEGHKPTHGGFDCALDAEHRAGHSLTDEVPWPKAAA
jgi:hypothetical protein